MSTVQPARSAHTAAWSALVALLLGLFASQYLTLPKLRDLVVASTVKLPIEKAQGSALDVVKAGWRTALNGGDFLLLGALAAVALWMLVTELHSRRYSSMLADFDSRPRAMLLLLALLGIAATRYYLNCGAVFMGDATMHIEVSAAVAEHLRQFSLPIWSNYWYNSFWLKIFCNLTNF